jgi:hypothetical protein
MPASCDSEGRAPLCILYTRAASLLGSLTVKPVGGHRPPLQLAGVQLDDQLFVDHRLDFFARRNAGHFAFESVAIDR